MIQAFYKEDITKRLAAIISYGLNGRYSCTAIEERIVASPFVNRLERNLFDPEESVEKTVEDAFEIKLGAEADISFRALFLAESYMKLFFSLNRSFEYLFLYWSLDGFLSKYGIYHEMDFSNLKEDFLSSVRRAPLLRRLSQERGIKLRDVARLSGISQNTINKYAKDDRCLYSCSQENGYRLSRLFNVKENLFVSNIGVYLDTAIYLSDDSYKDYRNYLGFYYACYFDAEMEEGDFDYDEENGRFVSNEGKMLRVLACEAENVDSSFILAHAKKGDYLVLFLMGVLHEDPKRYFAVKKEGAREILIVGSENVYLVKKGRKKRITYTAMNALMVRAKQSASLLTSPRS